MMIMFANLWGWREGRKNAQTSPTPRRKTLTRELWAFLLFFSWINVHRGAERFPLSNIKLVRPWWLELIACVLHHRTTICAYLDGYLLFLNDPAWTIRRVCVTPWDFASVRVRHPDKPPRDLHCSVPKFSTILSTCLIVQHASELFSPAVWAGRPSVFSSRFVAVFHHGAAQLDPHYLASSTCAFVFSLSAQLERPILASNRGTSRFCLLVGLQFSMDVLTSFHRGRSWIIWCWLHFQWQGTFCGSIHVRRPFLRPPQPYFAAYLLPLRIFGWQYRIFNRFPCIDEMYPVQSRIFVDLFQFRPILSVISRANVGLFIPQIDDFGFTYQIDQARVAMVKYFGAAHCFFRGFRCPVVNTVRITFPKYFQWNVPSIFLRNSS